MFKVLKGNESAPSLSRVDKMIIDVYLNKLMIDAADTFISSINRIFDNQFIPKCIKEKMMNKEINNLLDNAPLIYENISYTLKLLETEYYPNNSAYRVMKEKILDITRNSLKDWSNYISNDLKTFCNEHNIINDKEYCKLIFNYTKNHKIYNKSLIDYLR